MGLSRVRLRIERIALALVAAMGVGFLAAAPAVAAVEETTASSIRVVDQNDLPVANATVNVTPVNAPAYPSFASTDGDGVVDLASIAGVREGSNPYLVWIDAGGTSQYWDGKSGSETAPVTISADAGQITAFVVVAPGSATIKGSVVDAITKKPLAANVQAYGFGSGFLGGSTASGSNGTYTLPINGSLPGQVNVSFNAFPTTGGGESDAPWGYIPQSWNGAEYFGGASPTPVPLAAGQTVENINAELRPWGLLTGTLSKTNGANVEPVPGGYVAVFGEDDENPIFTTWADDSGSYTVPVAPGAYKVGFNSYSTGTSLVEDENGNDRSSDIEQYFDLAASLAEADDVTVVGAEETGNVNAIFGAQSGVDAVKPGVATIVGTPAIGSTLTVDPGTWTPAGVSFAYQWLRDGEAIEGATNNTYAPTLADADFDISVRVTGTKAGLNPGVTTSAVVGPVVDPTPGSLEIIVVDQDGERVANAPVTATNENGAAVFFSGATDAEGEAHFENVPRGEYRLWAYPPQIGTAATTTATVTARTETTVELEISTEADVPEGVTIQPSTPSWNGGVSLSRGQAFDFEAMRDSGAVTATYEVRSAGEVLSSGSLTETVLTGGTSAYGATIPGITVGGRSQITATLTYADGSTETVVVDLYIDPSGTVVDQYGTPLDGAGVAISRSDTQGGTFTAVPDGSPLLSPRNRTNPDVTSGGGLFGWDTVPGWYKVAAATTGSTPAVVETAALEVPPERLDLVLALPTGSAPQPTTAPVISGTPAAGSILSVSNGVWPTPATDVAPIGVQGYQWTRNGSPIAGATGPTYTLTAADTDSRVGVVVTLGRDIAADAGEVVDFPYAVAPKLVVPTALAATGGSSAATSGLAGIGVLLVFAGAAGYVLHRRRREAVTE